MTDFRSLLKSGRFLYLDGGMGTMLQAAGVQTDHVPELLNITDPEVIMTVHRKYANAGSDVVYANTFGANRYKLQDCGHSVTEVVSAGIANAKKAVDGKSLVALDIGPIGQLLEPTGSLKFEDAYDTYKEIVLAGSDADLIAIETMTDLYEVKAAMLAIKENTDKPLFVSVTFQENGNMLTGASPEQAVALIEGLGADVVAVNCALGPNELQPIIMRMLNTARIPMLVQPNAGLPKFRDGQTYYDVGPDEFSDYIRKFAEAGISGFGGCCGTTPEHIRMCCEKTKGLKVNFHPAEEVARVCGTTTLVEFRNRVIRCGERLNPTGKKKMKLALAEGRLYDIVDEGIAQVEAGADVLDVNVGVPGIDETSVMCELLTNLQEVIDLPLQIDSSNPETLEKACRIYNGLPLINSVNGKKEVMDAIFPIVKKYGGTVIGLCIDEDGIPPTAPQRFEIAQRIINEAAKYGISHKRIVIDSLVLTASAQQKEVIETAKCVGLVTDKLGCPTALGLSNVSFGLPNRPLINRTFLVMALYAGLKLPILNPLDKELMGAIDAFEVLNYSDVNAEDYISRHMNDVVAKPGSAPAPGAEASAASSNDAELEGKSALFKAIVKGQKHQAVDAVKAMDIEPLEIVSDHLVPALDKVGRDYDKGVIFLPQLMVSAETAKLVFDEIKEKLVSNDGPSKGCVVIATVQNDVHDIGKNIVKVVLQSYGFEVIDLGKDVPPEVVCDACREYNPIAVGLSALMTTTVVSMEATIKMMREQGITIPTFCGGAVVTDDVVKKIGGDYYAADAMESVRICEKLSEKN